MTWTCPACQSTNDPRGAFCVVCGSARPTEGPSGDAGAPSVPVVPIVRPASATPADPPPPGVPAADANLPPAASTSPPPPPTPTGADPTPGGGRSSTPWIVAAAVLVAALAIAGALILTSSKGDDDVTSKDDPKESTDSPTSDDGGDGDASDDDGTSSTTTEDPTTTTTTQPETGPLVAATATATNSRANVELKCGEYDGHSSYANYGPTSIIDGDTYTGWGASSGDGTGESVTITFDEPVHLTRIGLTPGFAKYGERSDQGCAVMSAFPYNRWVPRVSYEFSDGTSVEQSFEQEADMQYLDLDEPVETTFVTMTILQTERSPGADDDTILSEISFEGWTS